MNLTVPAPTPISEDQQTTESMFGDYQVHTLVKGG